MVRQPQPHPFIEMLPKPLKGTVQLEPEEFGGLLLEYLNSGDVTYKSQFWSDNLGNDGNLYNSITIAIQNKDDALERAIIEAWSWLEREGLLVRHPQGGWLVSRRGQQAKNREQVHAMRRASDLPRNMLNARILAKVWAPFLHGNYDTAIFAAFLEVEIAVREAAKLDASDVGCDLMRKAFGQGKPLADQTALPGEQDALSHLFAGSMGYYRNPFGHRRVSISDHSEAIEMVMLANHLLRIVESRVHT
jgi:uncharacterized protein (TIGR02391 family)